jgi:hypothetical protein
VGLFCTFASQFYPFLPCIFDYFATVIRVFFWRAKGVIDKIARAARYGSFSALLAVRLSPCL